MASHSLKATLKPKNSPGKSRGSKPAQVLFEQASSARQRAHAPYSNFQVGAALRTGSGRVVSGCNVENASYGATICAERTAILAAVAGGESEFTEICVVAKSKKLVPPCALCLQVMAEFCKPSFKVHLADLKGVQKTYTLGELLPHPFNRDFL